MSFDFAHSINTATKSSVAKRLAIGLLVGAFGLAAACGSGGGKPSSNGGGGAGVSVGSIVVSGATQKPRTTTWSVNYWQWMPSIGDGVSGTEAQVAALKPALLRVGGYNNDANTPDPFDHAQLDRAVAYAHAIGAEPFIQVPLLADIDGSPATAASAAEMINYANVTKSYGIKYFSVGNEPDLYATQGSLSDATQPAIPQYGPSDYCASARAYVTAMKAVDPSIQVVGPELAWHYQPGSDWLTPILKDCGELFDVVSIHRYPFSAKQATLESAKGDATQFDAVLTSVRGLMQAAGYGDKPLALTEMNVAYDATLCQLGASPATIGSALWLADGLGTAISDDLWTSAIWDISDDDSWALGMIGVPPAHTPRPEYYAYELYADHFGPTRLDVTQEPPGIRAYASRNQANDTTDLIVINWNTSSAPLAFQVSALAATPAAATYTVPALSISAVEIPDRGAATAWAYGDAQQMAGQGPTVLGAGASAASDAGAPVLDHACSGDAAIHCPRIMLPSAPITTQGGTDGVDLTFGSAPYAWHSYTYAASGQTAPTATLTPDGNGIQLTGGFVAPVTKNWAGMGLYFDGSSCIDGSSYTGLKFDFSGDLGGCTLAFGANFSGDNSSQDDPARGACPGSDSICYPPMATVPPLSTTDAGPETFRFPFSSLNGGSPNAELDPTTILTVQWQLGAPSGGAGCSFSVKLENVAFY